MTMCAVPAQVRLVAVDIDGTLLDSQGRLPVAHREAVAAVHAAGVLVVLATGRAHHFAQPVAEALGVPVAIITNNGAVARAVDGGVALRHVLPRGCARAILDATRPLADSVAVVFDQPGRAPIVYEHMDWSHPHRRGYFERNRAHIAAGPLAAALAEDPIQVMFNGSVNPMRRLVAQLRALPTADRCTVAITEYVERDFALVDVNGPGCSKGTTLAQLARLEGIAAAEVMAIGDNLNDLEMLEFAGCPVVMGNASAPLMQRGFPVVPSHDADGLAVALRRYALRDGATS